MMETTELVKCEILIGSQIGQARFNRFVDARNAYVGYPKQFKCLSCDQKWTSADCGNDLNTASCSNCYSDAVVITQVELVFHMNF